VAVGVTHHVALSPLGAEDLLESGNFRARCAQQQLSASSPLQTFRVTVDGDIGRVEIPVDVPVAVPVAVPVTVHVKSA
jgi:hypothetical protein